MTRKRTSATFGLYTCGLIFCGVAQSAELTEQIYDRSAVFERLDLNGDGKIDLTEYNGTRKLFAATDADGDGSINLAESAYMITFSDVPSGSFTMGSDDPRAVAGGPRPSAPSPEHRVSVDGFLMSTTEITTAQFARYLNAALHDGEIVVERANSGPGRMVYPVPTWTVIGAPGTEYERNAYASLSPLSGLSHLYAPGHPLRIPEHPLNQSWIDYIPELELFTVAAGFEDWPAAFIRWYGAMAFADYYDLTLPTEAEWEFAARGGNQFGYATSNGESGCEVANYKCYNGMLRENYAGVDTPEEYQGHRVRVGSYPPNPYGLHDLAGNVWEWCLDWFDDEFYQRTLDAGSARNPLNLDGAEPPEFLSGAGDGGTHDMRVSRGGSYNYGEQATASTARMGMPPYRGNDHWGFRVALRSPSTVFNGTE